MPGAEFIRHPFDFTIRQASVLGDFYQVPFIFRKLFITSSPDVISYVLQKNQKNYIKSIAYRHLKLALGNGLVTSEGEFWRRQRRLAQPAFYKTQLEALFKVMTGVAEDYLFKLASRVPESETLDISKEMMGVTADIVFQTLFSAKNSADISEMYRIMVEAQDYIVYRTLSPHLIPLAYFSGRHRRFKKDMQWFNSHILNIIDKRRSQESPPPDLLTMLLQTRDEETGETMNDQQLRDEAVTLFTAGHETSSNALAWTLYLLSQHPEVLEQLRSEVNRVIGDKTPAFEDLRNLTYTQQVLQEGMRLYPPAFAVGRQPLEDDVILDQKIPAGSVIFISIAALHRDPKFWERPHEFYPAHFEATREKLRPRLAYMPFGAGPRMCIGNHFAMMEMQLLLSMFVRQFDFELAENHPIETEPLITLKPKYGIKLKITPRVKPEG